MISASNLFKSYGSTTVLIDISFTVNLREHAGLIGANGSGKTTFLKILAGIESYDSGKIVRSSSLRIGYLPQTIAGTEDQTVDSILMRATREIREIEMRLRDLEKVMKTGNQSNVPEILGEYSQLLERYDQLGGYDVDRVTEIMFSGLGISSIDKARTISSLSGGEKTRLSLAATLLGAPDLLLLDEPTNNLDLQSIEWLEHFLAGYKGAVLTASHDRQFLNDTVNSVYEIDEYSHRLKHYTGNYDDFLNAKQAERLKWETDYQRQQDEIATLRNTLRNTKNSSSSRSRKPRDADKFIRYFKEQRAQRSDSRVFRNIEERLRRIESDPIPKPSKPLEFRPADKLRSIRSTVVLSAIDISKSFGVKCVLDNISFTVNHDSRMVITGPNGSGKTTLLQILTGNDKSDSGEVIYAPSVRIGYLPQEPEVEIKEQNMLDYFRRGLVGYDDDFIYDLVTCGLFRYEDLRKSVRQLSLGQMRKLQIARMIAEEPNVLILDEPTNHVSLDVLESFEDALVSFQGPILAVSHDRRFIQKFGKSIWQIKEGRLSSM